MQILFRTAVNSLIPKAIDSALSFFTKKTDLPKKRKKRDSTRLTQSMYDYIMLKHTFWINSGKRYYSENTLCNNQKELSELLNNDLKLNKSRNFYCSVFNKKVDYNKLPKGKDV